MRAHLRKFAHADRSTQAAFYSKPCAQHTLLIAPVYVAISSSRGRNLKMSTAYDEVVELAIRAIIQVRGLCITGWKVYNTSCLVSVKTRLYPPFRPVSGSELGLGLEIGLGRVVSYRCKNVCARMEMHQPHPNSAPPNGCHQALTLEADRVFKRTVKEEHDFNKFQQQREKVRYCLRSVLCLTTLSSHEYVAS